MALIDRKEPQNPTIKESADTERKLNIATPTKSEAKLQSKDRKNIKVSPNTFSLLKTICTMKELKLYELIDELLHVYTEERVTDRDKRMLKNITNIKK